MSINVDSLLASGLTATIIGIFQLVGNRYTNRMLDKIEKSIENKNKVGGN
jgi:hypothetical protein